MNKDLIVRWTILILILVVGLLVVRTCMRKFHPTSMSFPAIEHSRNSVITSPKRVDQNFRQV